MFYRPFFQPAYAPGQIIAMKDQEVVFGCRMQVVVIRSSVGDLLILVTDLHAWDACLTYRRKWSVECTFSSMKSRRFDLELTAITQAKRLSRLFGLITLAWVWCLRAGVERVDERAIPIKAHGRAAMSVVTYGWEVLAHALRWDEVRVTAFVRLLTHPFTAPVATETQDVRY